MKSFLRFSIYLFNRTIRLLAVTSFAFFLIPGCRSTFEESIFIDAPPSAVFKVITDYENYDVMFPDLHDEVLIVSDVKKGKGVSWKSSGTFNGVTFTSTWTVTEFLPDRFLKMEDLVDRSGVAVLKLETLPGNKTHYSMSITTKMFLPYKEKFHKIYRKEMQTVKKIAENSIQ